jgi:predicted transcriptional regulator of viral defense system
LRENVINRLNKAIITTRDARRVHVSSSSLSRLASSGVISRVARGVYLNTRATEQIPIHIEDLISSVKSVRYGAICLISALSYYKLTNEIPRENWISIPQNFNPRKRRNIRFVKLPDYKLGLKLLRIKGVTVKIYDEEMTIVDSFKYLSFETAIEALENYFRKKRNPDIEKLKKYSKERSIDISRYLEEVYSL